MKHRVTTSPRTGAPTFNSNERAFTPSQPASGGPRLPFDRRAGSDALEAGAVSVPHAGLDPLLTVDETAALLRVSPRHVRRLIASGELPVVRIGKAVRVRPEDLRQLIGGSVR
jgi:excisionase family DNA binding protein